KQIGPPLCAAVCLLPLLAPAGRRGAFFVAAGVVGLLAALTAVLNPACIPFGLMATALAVVVFAWRGRAALGLPPWRTVAALAGLGLVCGGLVVGCDPYFRWMARNRLPGVAEPTAATEPEAPAAPA